MRATFKALLLGIAMVIMLAPAEAETKLTVIVFPGVQNLPMFAAQAKGFFAKRGLAADLKFTPNSDELRNGVAEGRYQIAHSAVDNALALKDKANVDIAVVFGGDDSFNRLVVQPEIKSLADIKGKTVAVDAVNTAYAFQLYEMLRQKGLNKGDYEVKAVGGTGQRLEAMTRDKTFAAAMMTPPFSMRAEEISRPQLLSEGAGRALAARSGHVEPHLVLAGTARGRVANLKLRSRRLCPPYRFPVS